MSVRNPNDDEVLLRHTKKMHIEIDYIVPKAVFEQGYDAVIRYLNPPDDVEAPLWYFSKKDRENYWHAWDSKNIDTSTPRIWEDL